VIMKKQIYISVLVLAMVSLVPVNLYADSQKEAALGVISRIVGSENAKSVVVEIKPSSNANPSYEYFAKGGRVYINGSDPVAVCRGFYDYLRSVHIGMVGWRGAVLRIPEKWPDAPTTKVTSPFRFNQMYNIVTAGYSFPYWDWQRWEHELDWLALHGYNMIMAPLATEAISERVWLKLGLSQADIDAYTCGPAHSPWHRMGNICGTDGPLPPEWHEDQVALQHKVLKRMRELGIEPIVQSFAGFVPHATKHIYPDETYFQSHWNGGFRNNRAPIYLMPESKLFAEIFRMYIDEWQKEFGEGRYFLIDTFNEIKKLPSKEGMTTEEVMAEYGRNLSKQLTQVVPDGVWVLQGWIFGYQRKMWMPGIVKALFSGVPDDKLLILDMIAQWNNFLGYYGKPWIYGFITNMGGRTPYAGNLKSYINGPSSMLRSSNKGNNVGFSNHSEGIEVSAVNFELLADSGWHSDMQFESWLKDYCINRYGSCPDEMISVWLRLSDSCFKNKGWAAKFAWETMGISNKKLFSQKFITAARDFLALREDFKDSPFYVDDAVEMASFVLGQKADEFFFAAKAALYEDDVDAYSENLEIAYGLLMQADRLLESHSLNRLERWIAFARSHSPDKNLQDYYEENARRIVTSWGPPVNDYSARVWSGLIRDFYVPRMKAMLDAGFNGRRFDRNQWEERWIRSEGISEAEPFDDPAEMAYKLVSAALSKKPPQIKKQKDSVIGEWNPGQISTEWKTIEYQIDPEMVSRLKAVRFVFTKGSHMLRIRKVELVCDGNTAAVEKHDGSTGDKNIRNKYLLKVPSGITANNGALIRAEVRSDGGTVSYGRIEAIYEK